MVEKLKKFILENKLAFEGTGSGLNSPCTILCGYADYIGASVVDVKNALRSDEGAGLSREIRNEIHRVYGFASTYNYGSWWERPQAKLEYKF
jgi:hypothetical protein